MRCAIGIDAGGTQTLAIAYDEAGQELGRALRGFGNPQAGREAAVAHIVQAAVAALPQGAPCALVYAGVSGVGSEEMRQSLSGEIEVALRQSGLEAELYVVVDAQLALQAHVGKQDGALLIAGTGSIAYVRKGDAFYRAGGWGHLLGDVGSGYEIAREAVRHMLRLCDRGAPDDALCVALRGAMGGDTIRDCVDVFHRSSKAEVAALSRVVDTAARGGDAAAKALLCAAGERLADMLLIAHERAQLDPTFALVEQGSVLEHAMGVREALYARLRDAGLSPQEMPPVPAQYAAVRALRGEL